MTRAEFVGLVNLGNPVECTMLELAGRVLRLTGFNMEFRHLS